MSPQGTESNDQDHQQGERPQLSFFLEKNQLAQKCHVRGRREENL